MSTVIRVENLSKLYRLGEVGTGSLAHDINRWWHHLRGKEDPYSQIGRVNDRTKKTENDWVYALKDINFEVRQGEVLGIIGRNGAGKSTLLKILSRVTSPTSGNIRVRGRIASLLEVGTGFHPELTGRDNIYLNGAILGMRKMEIDHKLDEIIDFSGCEAYLDTPVKRYSSGMTVRLAFAVAAHLDPEILIVDEVLAVGDAEFQRKCLGKMQDISRNQGRTILFVSHQLVAVKTLCGSALLMGDGKVKGKGDVTSIIDCYTLNSPEHRSVTNWSEKVDAPGGSHGSITRAQIDVEGSCTSRVPVNKPMKVVIDYRANKSGSRLHVAIHLRNRNGNCLFSAANLRSTSSDKHGIGGQPHTIGSYVTEFTIAPFFLNIGHYSISAYLAVDVTLPEAHAVDCLHFEVVETGEMSQEYVGNWPGHLRPLLECRTISAPVDHFLIN